MEIKPKIKGWQEGILSKDLRSVGGTVLKKGSIVRYKRYKEFDNDFHTGKLEWTGKHEWHYIDQSNSNLIRGNDELLIET